MKIYLANGLFTVADRAFNEMIYNKLREAGHDVYAPQFNLAINDKTKSATSIPIYEGDTEKLKWCDVLVAVLDGQDLGVASEVGWVAGYNEVKSALEADALRYGDEPPAKKKIIGIWTDNRDASKTYSEEKNTDMKDYGLAESQYPYLNLYTVGCVKKYGTIVDSIDKVLKELE